ncbi:hypothetical protein [Mycolicibacterium austroafricanum]|nr:hypothetical protein [Mycolicibacterium austroafricanum]QZT61248.1 hypothetical protein JN085_19975 [Mycolicibacterium austroafricanum]
MAEKKSETVNLIAPNGLTVSVSESKLAERLHGGYRLAETPSRSRSKK